MSDELNTPAVTQSESVSTPPTESVSVQESESTTAQSENVESSPFSKDDAWSDFGKPEGEKQDESEKEELKPEEKAEDKPEAEKSDESSLSEEDAILEELFSDEELDAIDPNEVIEAQGSRRKKAAARRNLELAEIAKDFQSNKPIEEVLERFQSLSPERYEALRETAAHSLVDAHPEQTFQRAFVVAMKAENPAYDWKADKLPTLKEFIDFKNGKETTSIAQAATTAPTAELDATIQKLDETLDFDWRDPANDDNFIESELAMVQAIRTLEAQNKEKSANEEARTKEFEEIKNELESIKNGFKSTEDSKLQETATQIVNDYRQSFQEKVLPLIAKNTGLEITEQDTPEIRGFKERELQRYSGTPYEKANNIPSHFELFAFNESSVKDQIDAIYERVSDAQIKQAQAQLKGDAEAVKRYKQDAEKERVGLGEMFARANKEYKAIYITPNLEMFDKLGMSLSSRQKEAAQRIEVANSGASTAPVQEPEPETADGVWDNMVTSVQQRQQQRAA